MPDGGVILMKFPFYIFFSYYHEHPKHIVHTDYIVVSCLPFPRIASSSRHLSPLTFERAQIS